MIDQIGQVLDIIENFLWDYLGFPAILIVGFWLSWKSGFIQIRGFPRVYKTFFRFLFGGEKDAHAPGIAPLKSFFAALGGCVGIGNIVSITTAIQIGGPGALLWVWLTAIVGSLVKYSEIYLGIRFRVPQGEYGYRGGPMFYLRKVASPWVAILFCIFLSIYGVEIFQFSVVATSLSELFSVDKTYMVVVLLVLVLFAEFGGLRRVGNLSAVLIPLFIAMYLSMGAWVLIQNIEKFPAILSDIFTSAFSSHAAIGGFAGSTLLMTISQGIRRGCNSSDIGVGYASIIYSESRVEKPETQASLIIFEVFLDTFVICTMSILLVLVTGTWHSGADALYLVYMALDQYFPYMNYFMPLFFILLGYSTIVTYFFAGIKTAEFVFPKYGRYVYYAYAVVVFWTFSFVQMTQAQSIMTIVGACLLALNLFGIWRLRHELQFNF